MIGGVVAGDVLKRVPRQRIATVVVDGLHHAPHKKPHAKARGHHGDLVGEASAHGVEDETLNRMVVKGAVRVGNVESVVSGVPMG